MEARAGPDKGKRAGRRWNHGGDRARVGRMVADRLLEQARDLAPEIVALRRAIHAEPELGLDTPLTLAKVRADLAALPLEWREGAMRAPRVVAKGAGLVALRIREIGAAHDVPTLEAPPLARALPRAAIRAVVIVVGTTMSAAFFWRLIG